jgi:hypothetical protein
MYRLADTEYDCKLEQGEDFSGSMNNLVSIFSFVLICPSALSARRPGLRDQSPLAAARWRLNDPGTTCGSPEGFAKASF